MHVSELEHFAAIYSNRISALLNHKTSCMTCVDRVAAGASTFATAAAGGSAALRL